MIKTINSNDVIYYISGGYSNLIIIVYFKGIEGKSIQFIKGKGFGFIGWNLSNNINENSLQFTFNQDNLLYEPIKALLNDNDKNIIADETAANHYEKNKQKVIVFKQEVDNITATFEYKDKNLLNIYHVSIRNIFKIEKEESYTNKKAEREKINAFFNEVYHVFGTFKDGDHYIPQDEKQLTKSLKK